MNENYRAFDKTLNDIGEDVLICGDKITLSYKKIKNRQQNNKPPEFYDFLEKCGLKKIVDGNGVKFLSQI